MLGADRAILEAHVRVCSYPLGLGLLTKELVPADKGADASQHHQNEDDHFDLAPAT